MQIYPYTPIPTEAGFSDWIYSVMGVPAQYLPVDSPVIGYAYNTSMGTVNPYFMNSPGPIYLQMVYNLAGHLLVTWAPDVPGLVYITVENVNYGFFQYLRKQNNMLGFTTGIVQSSSDEGTSASMVVPRQAENLTIGQLQLTTTVWGRTYLGYAQDYGTNWGLD